MEIKPDGGTVCIQSGGAAAANHNERMQGIRDTLGGMTGTTSPGERLTGQNGWTEVDGCPLYTDDDFPRSVQQFEDIHGGEPGRRCLPADRRLPAVRARRQPRGGRAVQGRRSHRVNWRLSWPTRLPVQIDQMKEGYSAGQVGQRPFEMGYEVMKAFAQMAAGGEPPADPTYTGLDVCTPETADTCIAQ